VYVLSAVDVGVKFGVPPELGPQIRDAIPQRAV